MVNKKYLDKVLDHLVRNTKLDYEREVVYTPVPYHLYTLHFPSPFQFFLSSRKLLSPPTFNLYCKNQFGLTYDEIRYVWEQYKKIILEKIKQQ